MSIEWSGDRDWCREPWSGTLSSAALAPPLLRALAAAPPTGVLDTRRAELAERHHMGPQKKKTRPLQMRVSHQEAMSHELAKRSGAYG